MTAMTATIIRLTLSVSYIHNSYETATYLTFTSINMRIEQQTDVSSQGSGSGWLLFLLAGKNVFPLQPGHPTCARPHKPCRFLHRTAAGPLLNPAWNILPCPEKFFLHWNLTVDTRAVSMTRRANRLRTPVGSSEPLSRLSLATLAIRFGFDTTETIIDNADNPPQVFWYILLYFLWLLIVSCCWNFSLNICVSN